MKVAVCVSGIPRSGRPSRDISLNMVNVEKAFPNADVFFGTWESYVQRASALYPQRNILSMVEPVIDYHPYIDAPADVIHTEKLRKMIRQSHSNETLREQYSHQTKQIIAHANMVSSIPATYNVIVRVRYDTYVSVKADFTEFLNRCEKDGTTFGFAWMPGRSNFDEVYTIESGSQYQERFLFDQLIIHRRDRFDPDIVYRLSSQRRLLPAEFGWWQVLGEPFDNNYQCVCGWANPDKSVDEVYLK